MQAGILQFSGTFIGSSSAQIARSSGIIDYYLGRLRSIIPLNGDQNFFQNFISPHLLPIPNVWLEYSFPNHPVVYSITDSAFLLHLQEKRHILESRDLSAGVREALEAFMDGRLFGAQQTLNIPPMPRIMPYIPFFI